MKFTKQLNLIFSMFFIFLVISTDIISINAKFQFSKRRNHKRYRQPMPTGCIKIVPKSNFDTEEFITAFLIRMTSTFAGEMGNLARSGVEWAAKSIFGKDSIVSDKVYTINNFPDDCISELVKTMDSHIEESEKEAQTFLDNQGKDKSHLYEKLGLDAESKAALESLKDKPKELCKKLNSISSLKESDRNFFLKPFHKLIELANEAIDKKKDLKTLEAESKNNFLFGLFYSESHVIKKTLFNTVSKLLKKRIESGMSDSLIEALKEFIKLTAERIGELNSEYETSKSLSSSNCSDLPETITDESKCVNAGFLTLVSSVWKTVKTRKFLTCMTAVVAEYQLSGTYLSTPINALLSMLGNITSLLLTKFLEATYYAIRIIALLTKASAKDTTVAKKSWNYGESAAYGVRLIIAILVKRRKFFRKFK